MPAIRFYKHDDIPMEMHKVKVVQQLNLLPVDQRLQKMKDAGFNTFQLHNGDIFMDMLTDSGVNAMSQEQLAGMMKPDDAYAGSESFYRMVDKLEEIFGIGNCLPAHQGRACENILAERFVKPGNCVIMNYHFTTAKAHITRKGGHVEELVKDEGLISKSDLPFKGDIDLDKLEACIQAEGADNVSFMRIEAGTNLIGGQPVSLQSFKDACAIARKHGIVSVLDASLLQDNLYFIKTRDPECADRSIRDICREIADQFVRQSQANGGYFSRRDLEEYECRWVDPISVHYRGYDVHEIPPNGQGIAALMALNTLKEFELKEKERPETYHMEIEAMKLAFADAFHYVSDSDRMTVDYHDFLKPEYGERRAKEIGDTAKNYGPIDLPGSGTVYLCTADGEGNMVSYIQSNYMGFGSGIVLEGYGVALQNRGADFSLDENHVNVLAPHKKTYHTIIPGFLTREGKAVGPFGVMGGYMQPQGHLQVVTNMIDFHMNPQMALDAPRWQWNRDGSLSIEKEAGEEIINGLIARGHDVKVMDSRTGFGRGQIILRLENGVLVGGTESRTDANIACC